MRELAVLPLLETLRDHADMPALYDLLDAPATGRSFCRVAADADHEVWLIAWAPGARTGIHDHGTATGAHTVLRGDLVEYPNGTASALERLCRGASRTYPPGYVHDVHNASDEPALSLHVYSPRLDAMNHFEIVDGNLTLTSAERGRS